MALNPLVLLQGQAPQFEPRSNALARVLALRNEQMTQAMRMEQFQAARQAMAQEQAQRQKVEQWRQSLPSPQMMASQQALQGGGGPTVSNAERMLPVDPRAQMLYGGMQAGAVTPADYMRAAFPEPKSDDYKVVGGSLVKVGPQGVTEAYRAPEAPKAAPAGVQEYEYAKSQGFKGSFEDWKRGNASAGAPKVEVPINLGQKGLDNTLKLRGDFRSEPIYKAYQETQSAYSQIKSALSKASPAGDLAGATKIMKILDPGSVVRESELGMAMAASGLLDRIENYAQNVMRGTKLTPTQRSDFLSLAERLYTESVKQYNAKRSEYEAIAARNQLNVDDVVGPAGAPASSGEIDFTKLPRRGGK